MQTGRGASGGSVWLSRQTPLHRRYSALKLIKHQTLSLHISNAGVLEQAAAYISLLTLHSDYCATTTLLPCLNGACAVTWNNPRFWTFEIDMASNARVSEFPPLAVPALMLSLPCTRRSCFVIFRFMAREQSSIMIVSFCSFGLNFLCCFHLRGCGKIK